MMGHTFLLFGNWAVKMEHLIGHGWKILGKWEDIFGKC